jgi:hypothetical protein
MWYLLVVPEGRGALISPTMAGQACGVGAAEAVAVSDSESVTLRQAVDSKSVCLGAKPLESESQSYFRTGGLLPITSSWRQAP